MVLENQLPRDVDHLQISQHSAMCGFFPNSARMIVGKIHTHTHTRAVFLALQQCLKY